MKLYNVDLHIHTVLSPCADLLMTPGNIIERSIQKGLDVIAITDHNSAANVKTVIEMAKNTGLHVIPGMELETAEEVHLLCLFNSLNQVLKWQEIVYASLPGRKNNEDFFGYQLLTDTNDRIVSREERLLATATTITLQEAVKEIRKLAGIAIPAHIDRSYSVINNLGFIPAELELRVLEISNNTTPYKIRNKYSFLNEYLFIKSSDSHYLQDLKPYMKMMLLEITTENIKKALSSNSKITLF